MPAVRIEGKAFEDPRFVILGEVLHLDRDAALLKMSRIWAFLTEQFQLDAPNYEITTRMVDAITGVPGFARAAVDADLAEQVSEERIRPRGTRGRIEWLSRKRAAAKKGGASNRARWEAKKGATGKPIGSRVAKPKQSPPTPALAPAIAISQEQQASVCAEPNVATPAASEDPPPRSAQNALRALHERIEAAAPLGIEKPPREQLDALSRLRAAHGDDAVERGIVHARSEGYWKAPVTYSFAKANWEVLIDRADRQTKRGSLRDAAARDDRDAWPAPPPVPGAGVGGGR